MVGAIYSITMLCYSYIYISIYIYAISMLCYPCCINDNCFIFKNNVNAEMGTQTKRMTGIKPL